MLDVGLANGTGGDDDIAVFVDRLAAAGSDRPTALAQEGIRNAIGAGRVPPGLRRLAEALAASVAELPPPPRHPAEDVGSVVSAVRTDALVVLDDFDEAAVAEAIAALLTEGRRVVVTGATPGESARVREALATDVVDRAVDAVPSLSPAELRELRRLLATSTPERRARGGQDLPPASALPSPDEVATLCAQAARPTGTSAGPWMVPGLLADLDQDRRAAVTSVARCVHRSLGALRPRTGRDWAWRLLSELIYSRHRAAFDRMLEDTAQAVAALDKARYAPPVSFHGAPPPGAVEVLRRYREFLETGGKPRSYFRSAVQREVQPVLQQARVGENTPETVDDVQRLIEHLEFDERRARIAEGCAEIGVPAPRDEGELVELAEELVKVAAAARSVGALRHDVLFIAADSPLSVPDVDSAEQVAEAIIDYAEHGSADEAAHRLDEMADALADHCVVAAMAPEHEQAIGALRERDAAAYAAAVEALDAARRDVRDEQQARALLRSLSAEAPRLAEAWTVLAEDDPIALGFAAFVPMDALLSALPPADSADVVLVLGSSGLGVERLLLAAVAPRMIAVVGPGERRDAGPSLLSILQRASALVIRGRGGAGGRVVPLPGGSGRNAPARVGQAGA
ncbi:hypothetical protein [Pseudonocardia nigra]|uniref:hypothetical protein n=1 Tax=Pseudonocardia nigra TaxID=1921578 RepID=UPI001C5E6FBA|nr:hypothetical protein [Pseudonocardia nigra]